MGLRSWRRNEPAAWGAAGGVVVSWNFKHLVNVRQEDGFNAADALHGWPPVRNVSPTEIIYGSAEESD